jgi:hypothetical protein
MNNYKKISMQIKRNEKIKILNKLNYYFCSKIISLIFFLFIFSRTSFVFKKEENYFLPVEEQQEFKDNEESGLIKIFSYSTYLSCFLMSTIYLLKINSILNERHIKEKEYFLNKKTIFFINYILKALSYLMLVISFNSVSRLSLMLLFITINTILDKKNNEEKLKIFPEFFSWEDKYLKNILFYSISISIIFPIISKIHINFFNKFVKKLEDITKKQEGLNKIFEWLKKTSIGEIIYLIINSSKTLLFWIVLVNFLNVSLSENISKNNNFWKEVDLIGKRIEEFKFLFKSQKTIGENLSKLEVISEKKIFIFFCCENFKIAPNFIKNYYLDNDAIFSQYFINKIEKTLSFINLVNNKIKNEKEKNFILYCLFNEYKSFEELDLIYERIDNLKYERRFPEIDLKFL